MTRLFESRRERRMVEVGFVIGILVGMVLLPLVLGLALWVTNRAAAPVAAQPASGLPDATFSLSREALQRLVDDALRETNIPLVSLRDPQIQLEPGGLMVLNMRGDTVLLGAQPITMRMRVVPTANGVGVQTERAEVAGGFNLAGGLTQTLDERINADLAQRLGFAERFEVTGVDGSDTAINIEARLRDQPAP